MSSPVYMEERTKLGVFEGLSARVASVSAYWLIKMTPSRLERVMRCVSISTGVSDYAKAKRLRTAVNSVSARCAGNGCLQRSVAVMLLARLHRVSLTWKCGFRTKPFIAHAWVEADGQPVEENMELSEFMISLEAGEFND